MSDKSSLSKEIFELCTKFYENERFMTYDINKKFQGYLINKESIDNLKNKIYYSKLYDYIKDSHNYPYKILKKNIEKLSLEKIEKSIVQEKYNNLEEFKALLDNNKEYYIINAFLWRKICKIENYSDKGISCILKSKNLINIFFRF